jgi:hypothetical protein
MTIGLRELEQGLLRLQMQEAEAEAALAQLREARLRQEGAVQWEKQRLEQEAAQGRPAEAPAQEA